MDEKPKNHTWSYHFFPALALAMACGLALLGTACATYDDTDAALPAGKYPLTLAATVEAPALTRSTTGNGWDGGERVAIRIGDEVKEYVSTSSGSLSASTPSDPFYWQRNNEIKNVSAWCQGMGYSGTLPTTWAVQSDQGSTNGSGYQGSDFLYAPPTDISFGGRASTILTFYHQTARVVINIKSGEAAASVDEIESVRIGYGDNLALSGSYTVSPDPGTTGGTWNTSGGSTMGTITPKKLDTPLTLADGGTAIASYAALVIPQDMTGKPFIAIRLKGDGRTYCYTPASAAANLESGKLYTYDVTVKNGYLEAVPTVDGAWANAGTTRVFTAGQLKPGDFYYSDGSTSDGGLRVLNLADSTVSRVNVNPATSGLRASRSVIGIVFWVGDPTEGAHDNGAVYTDFGDSTLRAEHPGCTHGLVVALKNASGANMHWQEENSYVRDWVRDSTTYKNIASNIGATDPVNKIRGYNNTEAIRGYNKLHDDRRKVLPVSAVDEYAQSVAAPNTSSGWYCPSVKELSLLCGKDANYYNSLQFNLGTCMKNIVNGSLEKTGASDYTALGQGSYWSSTEYEYECKHAWTVKFDKGEVRYSSSKSSNQLSVRAILAF